jgi:glutaredoxin
MITLIGKPNCTNCLITKKIFDNNGIEYEYKLLDDFTSEEKKHLLAEARIKGNMQMPIILKNGESVTREVVLSEIKQ